MVNKYDYIQRRGVTLKSNRSRSLKMGPIDSRACLTITSSGVCFVSKQLASTSFCRQVLSTLLVQRWRDSSGNVRLSNLLISSCWVFALPVSSKPNAWACRVCRAIQIQNTNTIKTYKAPLYKTGQERYKSTVSGYMHEQKVQFQWSINDKKLQRYDAMQTRPMPSCGVCLSICHVRTFCQNE